MTDDPTGPQASDPRYLPELPVPGPPAVPPPVTPPPPGTPPPGSLGPSGNKGWRWFYALYAFFGALVVSQIAILIIGGIWIGLSDGLTFEQLSDQSRFIVFASAVSQLLFIGTAVFVARISGSFRWRDLGLVRAPFWKTVGLMAAVMLSYLVILGVYNQLVNLAPDDAPEKLGANSGDLNMLFFALLVAVLAPIAEEIFFRGLIFRALWNGIGLWPAAIVSGLLFGSMHIDSLSSDRLLQVVPLAVLGVSFALLYSWTGTLYSTIALHATNNSIAVAAYAEKNDSEFGLVLAGVLWILMMLGCAFGHLLTDKKSETPPSGLSGSDDGPVEYALTR